jgi:hypothetical protein
MRYLLIGGRNLVLPTKGSSIIRVPLVIMAVSLIANIKLMDTNI